MRKLLRKSLKDEKKRKKTDANEVVGVSTSSALEKGPMLEPIMIMIPSIEEETILSTPATIRVTDVVLEAKETSLNLTNLQS